MSDEENNEESKGFKIKDKRRFDSTGEARDLASDAPEKEAPKPDEAAFEMKDAPSDEGSVPPHMEVSFSSFVVSLATQALMQLGEVPAPEGVNVPVDPVGAKQTIDILSILEEKTKGNLDKNEAQLVEEVLHNVRMVFLKHQ